MSEPFYLGAYWGPRRELVDACASRLARCMEGLARQSEMLAAWYLAADGTSGATQSPVSRDERQLAQLLRSGVNRRDTDSSVISELGFSAALWNGDFERPIGLSAKCGAWSPAVPNSFVIELPPPNGPTISVYEPKTANAMLAVVIEAWEPLWATWTNDSLRQAQEAPPGTPVLGWATYLPSLRAIPDEDIPLGVETEQFGSGALVKIGESPSHVDASVLSEARSFLAAALAGVTS